MRSEIIDKITRVCQRMFDEGEVDRSAYDRVDLLCENADAADHAGCACRCDALIIAALDVLFGGGNAG